ncbi:MAG: hypothetical protein LBE13_16990, partial [Bacteroidales bacterium]|nr:hypothetical protein [Bacteroidales bacterium]
MNYELKNFIANQRRHCEQIRRHCERSEERHCERSEATPNNKASSPTTPSLPNTPSLRGARPKNVIARSATKERQCGGGTTDATP